MVPLIACREVAPDAEIVVAATEPPDKLVELFASVACVAVDALPTRFPVMFPVTFKVDAIVTAAEKAAVVAVIPALKRCSAVQVGEIAWLIAGAESEARIVAATPVTAVRPTKAVGPASTPAPPATPCGPCAPVAPVVP